VAIVVGLAFGASIFIDIYLKSLQAKKTKLEIAQLKKQQ